MITRAEIQAIRSLADKRGRIEQRAFVAEGEKLVDELRHSSLRVRRTLATEPIWSDAEIVSTKEMERISQLKTANRALAIVDIPDYDLRLANPAEGLVLALDRVQNPGNLGTILRIADWFGIEAVFAAKDSVDVFNPKVVQATMGAVFRVKMHYVDLPELSRLVLSLGGKIYGTFLDGENIYGRHLDTGTDCPVLVVIGNESDGISDEMATLVSDRLFIPPYPADQPGSESLNAAVATAVTIAEFRRRTEA